MPEKVGYQKSRRKRERRVNKRKQKTLPKNRIARYLETQRTRPPEAPHPVAARRVIRGAKKAKKAERRRRK